MQNVRLLFPTVCLVVAAPVLHAQQSTSDAHKWADSISKLDNAAIQHRDFAGLENAYAVSQRALTAFPNDPLLEHYLGYTLYSEGMMAMQDPKLRPSAQHLLDSALVALDRSTATMPLPETYALEYAIYGQMIGLSGDPMSGTVLGPKSEQALDEALKLGPNNPRVWLIRGIGAMFAPVEYGGGTANAEQYLTHALALYDADKQAAPLPTWGHADAYLWLGQAYMKAGKRDLARTAFENAAKLEPNNGWAKQLLASVNAAPQTK